MNRLDVKTGIVHDMAFDHAHPQRARELRISERRETIIPGADALAVDIPTVLRAAAEDATATREQRDAATGIPGYGRLAARS